MSDAFPSNYLRASDLQNRTVRVVISGIQSEKIGDDTKPVLYFQGKAKGLVLNKTNANNIALVYGDESDNWMNRPLDIYPTMVDYQGRSVEAIRVKVPPITQPVAPPVQQSAADMPPDYDDEIPF
jgi:hypothetical protein